MRVRSLRALLALLLLASALQLGACSSPDEPEATTPAESPAPTEQDEGSGIPAGDAAQDAVDEMNETIEQRTDTDE